MQTLYDLLVFKVYFCWLQSRGTPRHWGWPYKNTELQATNKGRLFFICGEESKETDCGKNRVGVNLNIYIYIDSLEESTPKLWSLLNLWTFTPKCWFHSQKSLPWSTSLVVRISIHPSDSNLVITLSVSHIITPAGGDKWIFESFTQ